MSKATKEKKFTSYQIFMIAVLAFIQFTIVLDFMVLSPLGAILRPELGISTAQFGIVVAGYAISAGLSGILAAGFADRFDRKKMLLFFYTGFVIGTFLCGIADTYEFLLAARIITGVFGGVIGSISFAIITDLFKWEVRGTVMGFVQASFAGAQALGLPAGITLAGWMGWHSPFLMIVAICLVIGVVLVIYMKPVDAHIVHSDTSSKNPFKHIGQTLSQTRYLRAFAATTLLATGGFMLMPFGADFAMHNLGLDFKTEIPLLYTVTGVISMFTGPLIGRLADSIGKYRMFVVGSIVTIALVIYYCNLDVTPLWLVITVSVVMFMGISARMISSSAIMTAVPDLRDRGAFMSINSSVQQISGGIAALCAGLIVVQQPGGKFEHYDILGYVVSASIIITTILIYPINRYVINNQAMANKNVGQTKPEQQPVSAALSE
jgi:predicted MFS family arabinose efflux permease